MTRQRPSTLIQVGLVQYPITSDREKNFRNSFELLGRLKKSRPNLIVLPEMWLGSPSLATDRASWMGFYSRALVDLRMWCRIHRVHAAFSQLEQDGRFYFNTAYWIDDHGAILHAYRKLHLFSLGGEHRIFNPGADWHAFQTPFGMAGMVICYDIRFPELTRALTHEGMELLIVPAQWPQARRHHWLTLTTARAIENQIFVFAANRLGKKQKLSFAGDSMVINPWGEKQMHLFSRQPVGVAQVDLEEVARVRRNYPFLKERRLK